MFRNSNISVLTLNGRGLKYSNFQILTTESSNKYSRYSMLSAKQQPSNVKNGGAIIYKAQRMGTDFWPIL